MAKESAALKLLFRLLAVPLLVSSLTLAADPIKHPNGQVAYDPNRKIVVHSNGRKAWDAGVLGAPGFFYHSNGTIAWDNSVLGSPRLFYANRQIAWDGLQNGTCYHPNGAIMKRGCDGLTISLGEGIELTRSLTSDWLTVYGERILLPPNAHR